MIRLARLGLFAVTCAVVVACNAQAGDDAAQGEAAETQVETVPVLGHRIDRIGRPEITNFVVRDPALKMIYNAEDSFAPSPSMLDKYIAAGKAAITHYDMMDGVQDWDDTGTAALAGILVDDQLRIDMSKPCDASGAEYLVSERAEVLGVEPATCGGRAPNEDVFDTLLTFYTNGPSKLTPRVGDGVDLVSSTGPATSAFPYLVEPHLLRPRPAP